MTPPAQPTLLDRHDALLVDLDGVVHLGDRPIPCAGPALDRARDAGLVVTFVTNNASRTAADVAAGLSAMGVRAAAGEVLTSSMAAADALSRQLPPGAEVLIVGGEGLREPVASAGLTPVAAANDNTLAVVQGWSADLTWAMLAEASVALLRGVPWVATNADATLPSPRGPLPGNGSMVAALRVATGREPVIVGKPEPALFRAAVKRSNATRPLFVGDRLDTDVVGARRAGVPSLLVLTGVSGVRDLLAASPAARPTYLGRDLMSVSGPAVAITDDGAVGDGLDELREACRRAWDGTLASDQYDATARALGLD